MSAAVVQLPAPKSEPVERLLKPRLAYTRKRGWVVVKPWFNPAFPEDIRWAVRPGSAEVVEYEVLAWADLPPVPDSAA